METEVCTKIKIKIYNALQKSISCIIIHILHFFLIKLRIKGKYIIQITIYARINAFFNPQHHGKYGEIFNYKDFVWPICFHAKFPAGEQGSQMVDRLSDDESKCLLCYSCIPNSLATPLTFRRSFSIPSSISLMKECSPKVDS